MARNATLLEGGVGFRRETVATVSAALKKAFFYPVLPKLPHGALTEVQLPIALVHSFHCQDLDSQTLVSENWNRVGISTAHRLLTIMNDR